MPGPSVAVEGGKIRHEPGPQRIEMDVAHQFEQVGILLADDRFVAVLKKVPRALMAAIEIEGIAGEKSAHEGGQPRGAGAEQQVNVVAHQRPGKAFDPGLDQKFREAMDEASPVGVVPEEVAAVHATNDHVLQQVGTV